MVQVPWLLLLCDNEDLCDSRALGRITSAQRIGFGLQNGVWHLTDSSVGPGYNEIYGTVRNYREVEKTINSRDVWPWAVAFSVPGSAACWPYHLFILDAHSRPAALM